MRTVKDALILAGGQGNRMLPASLYSAKETLPLIDTPLINHLIWEACQAGVEKIHIIHSPDKKSQFEKILANRCLDGNSKRKVDLPHHALDVIPREIELELHEQREPGGVGDAITAAIDSINGPFLLILGDNLLIKNHMSPQNIGPMSGSKSSKRLVQNYQKNGLSCAGIKEIDANDLNKYGVVKLEENLIKSIIEKPESNQAPSNYILCGRYILLSDTKELLKLYPKKEFGELQSIAILNHHINNLGLDAVKLDDYDLYDSGDPLSWIKSQIDHALKRDDMREEVKQFINKIIDFKQ